MTLTRISFQRSRRNLRLGVGDDPFLEDAGLEGLLGELANIETIDDLAKWRISVLGRYEAFVAPEGIETAREAERFLGGKLKEVVNAVAEVEKEIECGHISRDHVTVAGNSALKKLQSGSTECKDKQPSLLLK